MGRRDESQQGTDHRRLAGAVRAKKTDRPGRERRRDLVQRALCAVDDADRVERDDGSRISHQMCNT